MMRAFDHQIQWARAIPIFLSVRICMMREAFDVSGAKHIRPISYKAEHMSIKPASEHF
jgi:hypothetical protein